jgi:hypothetical protein
LLVELKRIVPLLLRFAAMANDAAATSAIKVWRESMFGSAFVVVVVAFKPDIVIIVYREADRHC